MSIPISKNSWLVHSKLYLTVDTRYWGLSMMPSIPQNQDDILYEVKIHDRIDNLAYSFYGDPRLEWIIKRANNIKLWPIGANPGVILRIPRKDRLESMGVIATI